MPASIEQIFDQGLSHHQAGRLAEAEQSYRLILESAPAHADSLHLLGVIALQTGHLESALNLIQRAVDLRPDGAIYRSNLGQVLERLHRLEDAEKAYRSAIDLDAHCAEAFNNLGHLLQGKGQLAEAEICFLKAIELAPDYAEPHTNMGNLLKDRGDLDGAIQAYRRAIELRPDLSMLHSNLLLTLHYHPDFSPADLAREHALWAERHVAPLGKAHADHRNDRDPDRRLRIGYVSPDFREHPVTRFMLPLLEHHSSNEVEIFGYADVPRPDSLTEAIRSKCDHWRDITMLSDAQLASRVRDDKIDILVDLAAHSGRNRLLAFARKPAPVQITYLAYCSTTGVDAIDYRLTDPILDPIPDRDGIYSERSIRLPRCYWCYAAPALDADQLPSIDRLPGPPTFGCLNNFAKITDATLGLWTQLLHQVPQANLLVYAPAEWQRARVRGALTRAGLAETRLIFVPRQPLQQYLETYRRIDVALDPFPYTGGTTTCDALWMGVPVVTLRGQTSVSRGGATLLSNAGLSDLIADDEAQYVQIATDLLHDAERLVSLRRTLRAQLESSPIMNAPQFARDLESVFRDAWKTWCNASASGDRER